MTKYSCGANGCNEQNKLMECPICKLLVCFDHYEHHDDKKGIQAHGV